MKIKPCSLQEILEGLHHIRKAFIGRSGVDGLYAVVVGFGEEGVGRVHLVEKLRHDAPDLSLTATFKSCVWFAVMIIFAKFRALEILRHGRGDKLDGIGLVVGLGGED